MRSSDASAAPIGVTSSSSRSSLAILSCCTEPPFAPEPVLVPERAELEPLPRVLADGALEAPHHVLHHRERLRLSRAPADHPERLGKEPIAPRPRARHEHRPDRHTRQPGEREGTVLEGGRLPEEVDPARHLTRGAAIELQGD